MTRSAIPLLLLSAACTCARAPSSAPTSEATDASDTRPYVAKAACPLPAAPSLEGVPEDAAKMLLDGRYDAAINAFDSAWDAGRDDEAFACAQEATRLGPEGALPHLDRARALDALGRFHEAHVAFERAHAIDPEDPEILSEFAEFLTREGSDDALETAVLHARAGREATVEASAAAPLAVTEAKALNMLGRSDDALVAAETAITLAFDVPGGLTERGVALFELLRFVEADAVLLSAMSSDPEDARALYFDGLCKERLGLEAEANKLLADATRLDPEAFPPPLALDANGFQKIFDEERAGLAEAERGKLAASDVSWAELPEITDLKGAEPVLSPTIVGLFRPGENGAKDAILLYRRNLLRITKTEEALRREVRDTLLHELGHQGGADDAELRDRGL